MLDLKMRINIKPTKSPGIIFLIKAAIQEFWHNDLSRLFFVALGGYAISASAILHSVGIDIETVLTSASVMYVVILLLALIDSRHTCQN